MNKNKNTAASLLTQLYQPPPIEPLQIHYEDDALLLVEKPSGLLSVPGRGEDKHDSLITRLQQDYPEALTVHRLDMSTSGLMLIARNPEMHKSLSILFQERRIEKNYEAIVDGVMPQCSGRIELPLIADWPNRPRQKVDFGIGKPSVTYYKVLSRTDACTRLDLKPETGRSHQLRVHLSEIYFPICGDELYNEQITSARLLLHATRLGFVHPGTNKHIEVNSAVPF